MDGSQVGRTLKRDVFGSVELVDDAFVRRVASGSWAPFSRLVARRLLERERRALLKLAGMSGVPRLVRVVAGDTPGPALAENTVERSLLRTFIVGVPLAEAERLPTNFFDELDALVIALHARGVCHNDLHKEQNVIVAADGYPWLVDFQLASVHEKGSRQLSRRALEDLRHVEKHRRRYTRDGRGPQGEQTFGRGAGARRSPLARVWRRVGKPVYNVVADTLAPRRGQEKRRASSGPWPAWTAPVAPRTFV